MSKECREFDLEERLVDFAVSVIRTSESLPKTKNGNHISGRLIPLGHHHLQIMAKPKGLRNPALNQYVQWIVGII